MIPVLRPLCPPPPAAEVTRSRHARAAAHLTPAYAVHHRVLSGDVAEQSGAGTERSCFGTTRLFSSASSGVGDQVVAAPRPVEGRRLARRRGTAQCLCLGPSRATSTVLPETTKKFVILAFLIWAKCYYVTYDLWDPLFFVLVVERRQRGVQIYHRRRRVILISCICRSGGGAGGSMRCAVVLAP